ncbi:MAG TPA: symmetrical bis(5'-nucleosyl)-tetraphosphatase [Anaeromyxobacter sp.]|jgi:bis(5'-nucleosyl)-tetraphosphatase (symmetrical)|nr:symmetrical bis(5'-nucleosyl)-tetraphosphatase [Anaeromyxobacter sp.]
MATFAVGDIQGCSSALRRVLERASFDRERDRVWLTGDLVNRGPDSAGVLRWARSLGDRAVVVLGNHDLNLLAIAHGQGREGSGARCRETLARILGEPDGRELLDWLGRQKLMHHEGGVAIVHAGLLPEWSIEQALELAREVEEELRDAPARLLGCMYGDEPARWRDGLARADRHRVVINAMTRLRMLDASGRMALSYSGAPAGAPEGLVSWFDFPGRASAATPIVCGHWAALGLVLRPDLLALDTGCGWGSQLTAVRLEDRAVFQASSDDER